MDRVGSPRGLIRYATENGVAERLTRPQMLRRVWRPRVLIYGAVLLAVSLGFVASLALRAPFHVDVIKDRGSLGRQLEDGRVENTYRVHVLNTDAEARRFTVSASGLPGLQAEWQSTLQIGGTERASMTLYLRAPAQAVQAHQGQARPVQIEVRRDDGATVQTKASFYVPR